MIQSTEWADEVTDRFVQLIGTNKQKVLVASETDSEGMLSLIVLSDDSVDNYSVNEKLVHLGMASSDIFSAMSNDDDWGSWCLCPMSQDFYSPKNTAELDTENYDSVTTGYIPKDEKRICRFFRDKSHCYKGI